MTDRRLQQASPLLLARTAGLLYLAIIVFGLLGVLLAAAGVTYLVGSYTRFLFPDHVLSITPIYLVAIVAETSMCLWLLLRGVDAREWAKAASP